jgi:hypothetical protein
MCNQIKASYDMPSCQYDLSSREGRVLDMTSTVRKGIGQAQATYSLSGGVANVKARGVKRNSNEQVKVVHVIPDMTDTERDVAKKRIGNDLHEIFLRIQEELNLGNELAQK